MPWKEGCCETLDYESRLYKLKPPSKPPKLKFFKKSWQSNENVKQSNITDISSPI